MEIWIFVFIQSVTAWVLKIPVLYYLETSKQNLVISDSTVTMTMSGQLFSSPLDSYIDFQDVIHPCGKVAVAENSKAYVAIDVAFLKKILNG